MSAQKTRMIDKVKFQVLSRKSEEHNMKGSLNQGLKIKITYKKKSYTFEFHDSVMNYQKGIETSKEQILDSMCDNWRYGAMTEDEIQDEFGSDMQFSTVQAVKKEGDALNILFNEDEIKELKRSANGEDFEATETKEFDDDDPLWSTKELKHLEGIGIKNEKTKYDISLINKRLKDDKFLLGETKDGSRVYLERGSFDCGWYYGFGYIETFQDGEWCSHTHFDGLNEGKNQNIRDALLEFFKGGKLTITSKETWVLCEYMLSFYTLKDAYEFYHTGGSHMTSDGTLNLKNTKRAKAILTDIKKVIIEAQKLLSPKDGNPEHIKDDIE